MLHKGSLSRHAVSVRLSVMFVDSVKINNRIVKFFHHRVGTPFQFFRTKCHGNIPTGNPLMGELNAGGVDRNRDSEPVKV